MNYYLILFILALLPFSTTSGQNTSLTQFIECIESQNGADNLLINGRPHLPENTRADGHPYFQSKEWTAGAIYISGTSYPVEQLKYSLFNDQLIIQHVRSNGVSQNVVLSELIVDSFQIGEHLFVNRALTLPKEENISFLEKIYGGKLSFYRYQEKVLSPITTLYPYGRFNHLRDVFFLMRDGEHYEINRRRDFLACFPDHKKDIKKYFRKNSLRWRKMTQAQYIHLLKFCDDQI